jgi:octaheme c-type cytochrome (tetrathionate reductase family)
MISALASLSGLTVAWTGAQAAQTEQQSAQTTPASSMPAPQMSGKKPGKTADHSKFEILQQNFKSGPEVTKACLSCHTEAADQIHDSIHWKWEYTNPTTGQTLGKKTVINAFCGNVASNEARCTSCHAGYGWEDVRQPPPSEPEAVDCLICHADTATYSKFPTKAGHPLYEPTPWKGKMKQPPNLSKAAMSVKNPQRQNCGSCHYYGGGGDAVKHGDLDSSLNHPGKELDVHMREDGLNMACTACHSGSGHQWPGSRYGSSAESNQKEGKGEKDSIKPMTAKMSKMSHMAESSSCESCHSDKPHPGNDLKSIKLNNHTDTVACQTCHIPEFARGGVATKTKWDWSTAGKLKDGKPFKIMDDHGHPSYLSTKGNFEYGENVTPHYAWYNGNFRYTLLDDKIDPTKTVELNAILGGPNDKQSKIWPFKKMETRQAYDTEKSQLVYTHVYGKDDTSLWTNFDWPKAIQAGMDYIGQDYSGKFDFVDTNMFWPITHMVAPAEKAVECQECHSKNGRMAGIEGVYIPGRDSFKWLDWLGYTAFGLTIFGVLLHGLLRFVLRNRKTAAKEG